MRASTPFHDGVQLKFLPILLKYFLRHLSYCHRKSFHDDMIKLMNSLTLIVILSLASTISEVPLIGIKKTLFEDLELPFEQ